MNKLKEQLAAMRDYLGRDNNGLRILDDLTAVANQMRKELAAFKELSDSERKSAASARAKLASSVKENEELKRSVERERSLREQRERDVVRLTDLLQNAEKERDALLPADVPAPERTETVSSLYSQDTGPTLVDDLRPFTAMFNDLRRNMRQPPKPTSLRNNVESVELTDVISSLSVDDLLKLGRFVACHALLGYPCLVCSEHTVPEVRLNKKLPEDMLRPFIMWVTRQGRNIDSRGINYVHPEQLTLNSRLSNTGA